MERRLAAILAADVVGYSRLMGADEAGTLERLQSLHKDLVKPAIAARKGRVVKLMGDGLLAEFPSVVEAVACAIDIQRAMPGREPEVVEENRILLRIGVNLGDIIVEDGDIYGDGVNVAARLEALADPGGICISGRVLDQVEKRVDVGFSFLGPKRVKNIERPVNAYAVLLDAADSGKVIGRPVPPRGLGKLRRSLPIVVPLAVLIVAGLGYWLYSDRSGLERVRTEQPTHPLSGKRSIAVLPFGNLSGESEQIYFADGITEDLITDLSRVQGLFVIARNSSFAIRDSENVLDAARALGAAYLLDGSVRREGDRIRINARLIDTVSGTEIWADRHDEPMTSIFDVQDTITRQIVDALDTEISADHRDVIAAHGTDNIAAYDAFLKGWDQFLRFTREGIKNARPYFEQAIELDPEYSRAYAALARTYSTAWNRGWYFELDWKDTRCEIERNLELSLRNPTPLSHLAAADKRLTDQRYEEAIEHINQGLELAPNDPDLLGFKGWAMTLVGRPAEALEAVELAMKLDPGDLARKKWVAGIALFAMERYDDALAAFEIAQSSNPQISAWPRIATLMKLGRRKDAEAALLEYFHIRGYSNATEVSQALDDIKDLPWGSVGALLNYFPFRRAEDVARLGTPLIELGWCCAEEIEERQSLLRTQGHARSAATERHLASINNGDLADCISH